MSEHSPVAFAPPDNVTGRSSDANSSMPGSHDGGLSPALVESIAGLSAGTIATLVVHPLDIVKTRMQSEFFPSCPPGGWRVKRVMEAYETRGERERHSRKKKKKKK